MLMENHTDYTRVQDSCVSRKLSQLICLCSAGMVVFFVCFISSSGNMGCVLIHPRHPTRATMDASHWDDGRHNFLHLLPMALASHAQG